MENAADYQQQRHTQQTNRQAAANRAYFQPVGRVLADNREPIQRIDNGVLQNSVLQNGVLQDKRQSSEQLKPLLRKMMDGPSANAPIQMAISYNAGQYKSREQLVEGLEVLFGKSASERIDFWVSQYQDAGGRAMYASQVFKRVIDHLQDEGFNAVRGVPVTGNNSEHGPQLPTRPGRDAADNAQQAMSSFLTGSCTLGRLTIRYNAESAVFHERQQDSNTHAEDGLIEQFNGYADANPGVDWTGVRVNLTINNFFCATETTKKSKSSHNCLDLIIALQNRYGFARFHVYFKNTYGDREHMDSSIARLQAAGILVTSFALEGDNVAYSSARLDPASDSEDESSGDEGGGEESKSDGEQSEQHQPDSDEPVAKRTRRTGALDPRLYGNIIDDNDTLTIDGARYQVIGVRDTGNCLFESLARYSLGDVGALRAMAVTQEQSNPGLYQVDEAHITALAQPTTYAQDKDIKAIADALGITIRVLTYTQGSTEPVQDTRYESGGNVYLIIQSHAHFRPVVPMPPNSASLL